MNWIDRNRDCFFLIFTIFLVNIGKLIESCDSIFQIDYFFYYRIFKVLGIVASSSSGQLLRSSIVFSWDETNVDFNIQFFTCRKESHGIYLAITYVILMVGLKASEACIPYPYLHDAVLIYFFLAFHSYHNPPCDISLQRINKLKRCRHVICRSQFIDVILDLIMF